MGVALIRRIVQQRKAAREAAIASPAPAETCGVCAGVCRCPFAGEMRLADIPLLQDVELVRIDLPEHELEPLLERGILPGCRLCPVRRSPSGDPILLVDGVMVAVRREMAGCLCVKHTASDAA